jgi:hypothetical protein
VNENELLRRAIDNEPVPRDLEARVRARLTSPGLAEGWGRLVSSLVMLVIVVAGVLFVSHRKTDQLLALGVNDHVHCAIAGNYPRQTMRVEMTQGLGPQFAPMLQPVIDAAGKSGMKIDSVVSAHRCTIMGRSYVHVILRRGQMLVSVILTRRENGDVFPGETLARMVHRSEVPLHDASVAGYSVAGFESGQWLGYVVSAMPELRNQELAERIAPVVANYTRG